MIRGFCGSIADLIVPPQGDDPHPTDFDRSADDCGSIRSVRSPITYSEEQGSRIL